MLARAFRFALTPERAWQRYASAPTVGATLRYFAVLATAPALAAAVLVARPDDAAAIMAISPLGPGSPFALALPPGWREGIPVTAAAGAHVLDRARVALLAYAGTWLTLAFGIVLLWALLPLFGARRALPDVTRLAIDAATPLLVSVLALLHPALAPVVALGAMQTCYVAWLGLQRLYRVPASEAGVALAVTVLAALVGSQIVGFALGALHAALSGP